MVSLVTGGGGFIGSHLVDALLARGDDVVVLDDFSSGDRARLPPTARLTVLEGSVEDRETVSNTLLLCQPGVIYHLAAMSRAGPSDWQMDRCEAVNVHGTRTILDAARLLWHTKPPRVVYAGSATYYGSQHSPQHERMPPDCQTPYAWSKYAGEQLCDLYMARGWVETMVLRYFSVYGPHQPMKGDDALVLGKFLRAKALGETMVLDGGGLQRRDFVHVSDVVRATIEAGTVPAMRGPFNIGSGKSTSIRQVAEWIGGNMVDGLARPGDALETCADLNRTWAYLRWGPTIDLKTSLEDLLG